MSLLAAGPLPGSLQAGEVLRAGVQDQLVDLRGGSAGRHVPRRRAASGRSLQRPILEKAYTWSDLYLGVLGRESECEVAELLLGEVVLEPGEEEDAPVVHPDGLVVLLGGHLLLASYHLGGGMVRRQETGARGQEAGDRRQEAGGRRKEEGDWGQGVGGRRPRLLPAV